MNDAISPDASWAAEIWDEVIGEGPLVATAIHDGHFIREEIVRLLVPDDLSRLREEDPFTSQWSLVAPTRVIGRRSRFEVDLNRPRDKAVYQTPEDAWGLELWREPLTDEMVSESLRYYDQFYERLREILDLKVAEHGKFVVLDLHTYNHRRSGPEGPVADPELNPQVNIGTGTMPREYWAPLVDRFIDELRAFDFPGGPLDVRENVRFRGGNLSGWIHEHYHETGCAIAIEVKKFFMDEWTGEPNSELIDTIGSALSWTAEGLRQELERYREAGS